MIGVDRLSYNKITRILMASKQWRESKFAQSFHARNPLTYPDWWAFLAFRGLGRGLIRPPLSYKNGLVYDDQTCRGWCDCYQFKFCYSCIFHTIMTWYDVIMTSLSWFYRPNLSPICLLETRCHGITKNDKHTHFFATCYQQNSRKIHQALFSAWFWTDKDNVALHLS